MEELNEYKKKLMMGIGEINGIEMADWPGVKNGIYISKDKIIELISNN